MPISDFNILKAWHFYFVNVAFLSTFMSSVRLRKSPSDGFQLNQKPVIK